MDPCLRSLRLSLVANAGGSPNPGEVTVKSDRRPLLGSDSHTRRLFELIVGKYLVSRIARGTGMIAWEVKEYEPIERVAFR